MEPSTVVGGGLALFGAKDLIVKLLGPTADYLGGGLKDYTKKGRENVSRVFDVAVRTLGPRMEEPGQVPPKVLKEVLDQGYFCEDQLAAEYLGGVLASSRTEVGRDDRGAAMLALIGRLSSYQLRCHYLFYAALRKECEGESGNLAMEIERNKLCFFIPFDSFSECMEFGQNENVNALIVHIMNGLQREVLIGHIWGSANAEILKSSLGFEAPSRGLVWTPSAVGLELFMWAHGISNISIHDFLNTTISYPPVEGIPALTGVIRKEKKPDQTEPNATTDVSSTNRPAHQP